jgi:DNA-binding MurR/RpiR family transcriptional regulator
VELIDSASGHFADVLLEDPSDRCLVIIDVRRYSSTSRHLAERAVDAGIPLVIITDTLCDWAPRLTANVLAADSDGALFWQSAVPMTGLVNLLVNDVVGHGGGRDVEERLERISALYEDFVGFVRPTRTRGGDA